MAGPKPAMPSDTRRDAKRVGPGKGRGESLRKRRKHFFHKTQQLRGVTTVNPPDAGLLGRQRAPAPPALVLTGFVLLEGQKPALLPVAFYNTPILKRDSRCTQL